MALRRPRHDTIIDDSDEFSIGAAERLAGLGGASLSS
jgi:hypothetical protein